MEFDFFAWLSDVKRKAREHWSYCRRASRERARHGAPTLEQMVGSAEFARLETSVYEPGCFTPEEDALLDSINLEETALMSCDEYVRRDLSRAFFNITVNLYNALGVPFRVDRGLLHELFWGS